MLFARHSSAIKRSYWPDFGYQVVQVFPILIAITAASFALGAKLHLQNGVYLPIIGSMKGGSAAPAKVFRIKQQQTGYAHQDFPPRIRATLGPTGIDQGVQLKSSEVRVFQTYTRGK